MAKGRGRKALAPWSKELYQMNAEQRAAYFNKINKRVTQGFRELKKQGFETAPVYQQMLKKGNVNKNNIPSFKNITKEEAKSWQSFRYRYEEMVRVYKAPSMSSSAKEQEEIRKNMLAQVGIDIEEEAEKRNMSVDDMMKNPSAFTDELNYFWDLYHAAKDAGLFEEFGISSLHSNVAQNIIKEYLDTSDGAYRPAVKDKFVTVKAHSKRHGDYEYTKKEKQSNVVSRAKKLAENQRLNAVSLHGADMSLDEARKIDFTRGYNENKLHSMTDALLYTLTKNRYGLDMSVSVNDSTPEEDRLFPK